MSWKKMVLTSRGGNLMEIKANWKRKEVMVTQLGGNPSAIDTSELVKDKPTKLKQSSTLYVLVGLYPHIVKFSKEKYQPPKTEESPVKEANTGTDPKPAEKDQMKNENGKMSRIAVSKNDRKRMSSEKVDEECKKRKLEHNDSDLESVRSVEGKLKMLKDSAKKTKLDGWLNSPHKEDRKVEIVKPELSPHSMTTQESSWQQHEKLFIYTSKDVQAREKIAGFDIDGTIITTQSGRVFPTHIGDWRILYSEMYGKLKKLHASGYKIVFFTNQLGVSRGKIKIEDLKEKLINVVSKCAVPVQILVSTGSGLFRKPCSGMWQHFCKKLNNSVKVNMKESFYCGDAAGRPQNWCPGRKKDFSCSDRLFALNIGLKFYTPEELIKDQKPSAYNMPEFDPRKLSAETNLVESPRGAQIVSPSQEIVVFAGYPASGKSFFARTYMAPKGYVVVNRDTLGTWQKCVSECNRAIKEGKSVVVDNTNPDKESRQRYVTCAVKSGVPCRCFVFNMSKDHIRHNERFREITDKTHKPVNDMIINSFKSKFTEPKMEEGFKEVVKINFVPKFESSVHEKLYRQFLLEK
ncbi:uncharacterized protein F21D5.5-like isoform X2 [Gigantopelta aegis]|uniref:uncharacterized protein F21D5.5-like isoform X2 n=1 Tax=Gigantopelta aegis TaxID=1735272 RepID=UPI001B88D329|nr:uncharacterized protein F21D5.5-like isoform X2 [Gigantopelta aegis]